MTRKLRTAVTSASAAVLLVSTAATAQAAPLGSHTNSCQAPPGKILLACDLLFADFPGGRIFVDVDADGFGTGHWILEQHGQPGWRTCESDFDLHAPAQTWECDGAPQDSYVLEVSGQTNTTFYRLGVHW